jgi:pyruvate-ferredoxin/flavodoxin oxidoreductase
MHPTRPTPRAGDAVVLDGLTAIAVTEAAMADTAALGADWPAAAAGRAWNREQTRRRLNRLGEVLASVHAPSPRGTLAAAVGTSLSGQRATTFLAGPDLLAARDTLALARGQHAPLVIHMAARAAAGHAQAIGSGHDAYHAATDSGCVQLFAVNVQEAVDLALVARRVAERALVPCIVAMDGEQTALAMQEVCLPGDELVEACVGTPHTVIESPTPAQRFIFGETRRLVPRLYDLERPLMLAPRDGPESWALGAAGHRPYFESHVPALMVEAFDRFAELTGRSYRPVLEHRVDDAEIVLVVQGSAVETVSAVADAARSTLRLKVGVLGIRCLRPLPMAEIAAGLRGARVAAILERTETPLADGPLAREVRVALDRARDNSRFGADTHPGCPAIADRDLPRLIGVPYGLGGAPLRAADVLELARELREPKRSLVHLGLDFVPRSPDYPRQQSLADALRRSYPELEHQGLRSNEPPPELLPGGATTMMLHRLAGSEHEPLAGEIAALVHAAFDGHVRSRPALTWHRYDEACSDVVVHAPAPLRDPGDDASVDILVTPLTSPRETSFERLGAQGVVLVAGDGDEHQDASLVAAWPPGARDRLRADGRTLFVAPMVAGDQAWRRAEALLGGIAALVARRQGETVSASEVRAARERGLAELTDEKREMRLEAFMTAYESLRRVEVPADEHDAQSPRPAGPGAALESGEDAGAADTVHARARFWNQVGVLYRDGATDRLAADPCLATGAVPPLTSTFRDVSRTGAVLPAFDPAACDGHPALWMSDPDGAVAPLVISARALLEAGLRMAAERGRPADALRAVLPKIARQVNVIVRAGEDAPTSAGAVLAAAFVAVTSTMEEPRRTTLREALDAVIAEVGELPVARTAVFFDEPEAKQAGTGELFTLAINPDACRSPEVIIARRGRAHQRGRRDRARAVAALAEAARHQRRDDRPGAQSPRGGHAGGAHAVATLSARDGAGRRRRDRLRSSARAVARPRACRVALPAARPEAAGRDRHAADPARRAHPRNALRRVAGRRPGRARPRAGRPRPRRRERRGALGTGRHRGQRWPRRRRRARPARGRGARARGPALAPLTRGVGAGPRPPRAGDRAGRRGDLGRRVPVQPVQRPGRHWRGDGDGAPGAGAARGPAAPDHGWTASRPGGGARARRVR